MLLALFFEAKKRSKNSICGRQGQFAPSILMAAPRFGPDARDDLRLDLLCKTLPTNGAASAAKPGGSAPQRQMGISH